jgi:predicted transcriptional regulator
MSVAKTTIYLDAAEYRQLKSLANAEGRKTAALVREAVAEYIAQRAVRTRAASVGVGRSGRGDVATRAEKLLAGMGRPRRK